jgi:hypothetical protein
MNTPPQPPVASDPQLREPLVRSLVELAGTPDDASDVDIHLAAIVRLAADLVAPVAYASVTALRGTGYTTVAASGDIALSVDKAQYADDAGPCLDALAEGRPIAVPDATATMAWPGFRETALRLGLHASFSVPLFAGRGVDIAALNLYSRDSVAMAPLTAQICAVYDPYAPVTEKHLQRLDPGSNQLVTGLASAFDVRATIQQAIGAVMARGNVTEDDAYVTLRMQAAQQGTPLVDAARSVLAGHRR